MGNQHIFKMKNIYFLRHGQTELNRKGVHQFPDTPLSDKGRRQAGAIARKLEDVPIDIIISSPLERAKETADIVAGVLDKKVETNANLVELRRPRELWGTSWFSPKSLWIMGLLYWRIGDDWHYGDEENLIDFYHRGKKALESISNMKEENILVVTHRGLMANMISRIKGDGLDTIKQNRIGLWKNLEIKNCCYLKTTWTEEGEWGETLNGTWTLEKGSFCP